jgi:hypothetical protein
VIVFWDVALCSVLEEVTDVSEALTFSIVNAMIPFISTRVPAQHTGTIVFILAYIPDNLQLTDLP